MVKSQMAKVNSVNFILKGKTPYKDLAPVFPDILKKILEVNGQDSDEDQIFDIILASNIPDLEQNRKPEGCNRKGRVRLVFPMDRPEFYIKTYIRSMELKPIGEEIGAMLVAAKIKFEMRTNDDVEFDAKSSESSGSR